MGMYAGTVIVTGAGRGLRRARVAGSKGGAP